MELQHYTDQIVALGQQEDLLQLGRSAGEIKQQFEDLLIELERQEQVKRLDANDAGTTYEEFDYKPLTANRYHLVSVSDPISRWLAH